MDTFVSFVVRALIHPAFEVLVLPLLVTGLAILLKCLARSGAASKLEVKSEDLLVGFELGVTACLTLVASAPKAADRYRSVQDQLKNSGSLAKDAIDALVQKSNSVIDFMIAAPLFTFLSIVALLGLALLLGQKGWKPCQAGAAATIHMGWIVGADVTGLFFLIGALALGSLIR